MMFSHLVGNDLLKKQLTKAIKTCSIKNAYLFAGVPGVGKCAFAYAFARSLLECTTDGPIPFHPDLFLYRGEGKTGYHSMESLQELASQCRQAPYQAKYRVFIIDQADRMLPTSANALLKSFEEPAETSVIILVSDHPEKLLSTIVSRCQRLFFRPVPKKKLAEHVRQQGVATEQAIQIAEQAEGSVSFALSLCDPASQSLRECVLSTLFSAAQRKWLQVQKGVEVLVQKIEEETGKLQEEKSRQWQLDQADEWGASLKNVAEKQLQAFTTINCQYYVDLIVNRAVCWCRDLHAIQLGAAASHPENIDVMWDLLQYRSPPSLEQALQAAQMAREGVKKSISLPFVLEIFFISLFN